MIFYEFIKGMLFLHIFFNEFIYVLPINEFKKILNDQFL